VQAQLDVVRSRLTHLRELEASLAAFVGDCDSACVSGANRDCCIVADLSAGAASASAASSKGDGGITELRRPV
jgi:hypothetical protein